VHSLLRSLKTTRLFFEKFQKTERLKKKTRQIDLLHSATLAVPSSYKHHLIMARCIFFLTLFIIFQGNVILSEILRMMSKITCCN